MRTILAVVASLLLGAGVAGATLWLYSQERFRAVEEAHLREKQEQGARINALVHENEALKQKTETLEDKLARVAELISLRRKARVARYRIYRLQVQAGACGDPPSPRPCPYGFWPLLGKLFEQASDVAKRFAPIETKFLTDFGAEETARAYSDDDRVACAVWQSGAGDEFMAKWGNPEIYIQGVGRDPALCRLRPEQRVALYTSMFGKRKG